MIFRWFLIRCISCFGSESITLSYGSRSCKKFRILPDPDPQHWLIRIRFRIGLTVACSQGNIAILTPMTLYEVKSKTNRTCQFKQKQQPLQQNIFYNFFQPRHCRYEHIFQISPAFSIRPWLRHLSSDLGAPPPMRAWGSPGQWEDFGHLVFHPGD
jgi:hypothetical protein